MQVCKNGERALLNAKWGLAAYRTLLPLLGAVPADPEPTPLRLVRGCIAMPFTADVRVVASMNRLADAVQGGELSYMTLAMECEQTTYRTLLPLLGEVPADPEPTPLRLVRGCITTPFTAGVRVVASMNRLADAVQGG